MIALLAAGIAPRIDAQTPPMLRYFWAEGCGACTRAKPFLERLQAAHPGLKIERYEVTTTPANWTLLQDAIDRYGVTRPTLPLFFYGEQFWVGFTEQVAGEIEQAVSVGSPASGPVSRSVVLPLLGSIDLDTLTAWAATALIALVDGFNPCSLWLLTFLLAVVVHTGSRGRIMAVGLAFLGVSASVYGAFMLGLFHAALLAASLGVVRIAVVVLALVFAAINIKDYFWLRKGPSLTISDGQKPAIGARVREIMRRKGSLPAMVAATAVMAAGVTLMELPCTVGLPIMWTQMMARAGVGGGVFAALLALYLLIFLADELAVLAVAAVTLRQARLQERHGRLLKLLAGTVMASLGFALLAAPERAGTLLGALVAFAAALVAAALIHSLATLAARYRRPAA
jgi:thiol-disulfide isomerase/thioredoxin